jgi:hypothetical protein
MQPIYPVLFWSSESNDAATSCFRCHAGSGQQTHAFLLLVEGFGFEPGEDDKRRRSPRREKTDGKKGHHTMSNQKSNSKWFAEETQGKMTVWHYDMRHIHPIIGRFPQWPIDYSLVAALETESLDEAYNWTNDDDGWQREEVSIMPPFGWDIADLSDEMSVPVFRCPRSSAVGDVFVMPSGKAYLIELQGFRYIGTCVD